MSPGDPSALVHAGLYSHNEYVLVDASLETRRGNEEIFDEPVGVHAD